MEIQTKISYLLAILYIIAGILYSAKYFTVSSITQVLLFIFLASVFYNVITFVRKDKPRDLWKLGWLGFVGLFSPFVFSYILGLQAVSAFFELSVFLGFFGLFRK